MADLVRGEANSKANPRVLFAWQSPNVGDSLETGIPPSKRQLKGGFFQPLEDPLTFTVRDPDGTIVVGPTAIDPTDEANQLDPGSEGGKGRIIVLPFTVPTTSATGAYTVEVTFTANPDDGPALDPQTVTYSFRVVDEDLGLVDGAYAQFTDMLDAGFPIGQPAPCGGYSLVDARRALLRASRYIEEITSRFFDPRYRVFDLDGKGGPIIQPDHAIVGLTDVTFTFTTFTPADLPIEEGDIRVYNRHIRQGLLEPDDRQDPRIEFLRTPVYRFPRSQLLGEVDILSSYIGFTESQQNVKVKGVWGYTDPDGSPFGKTPDLITEVCLRLAARYIQPLWRQVGGAGNRDQAAGPILTEKTLDQSVTFANVAGSSAGGGAGAYTGAFTGDPEIDQILAIYMAPPKFRAA
jgi:hypothetical protein